jgi:putative ABC transport system substrate-binding protein
LAAEVVRQQVAVILTSNDGPALAAKRATSTIPIVFFAISSDPITLGLVTSINRPGGNITGVSYDEPQVLSKRLDLLCQFVPSATTIAFLIRGRGLLSFEEQKNTLVATAGRLGRELIIVECNRDQELGRCFASIADRGTGAVVVASLFPPTVVSFAAQYNIPAIYNDREFVVSGGLMSYGYDRNDQIRLATGLVGQILKGARPADLPIRRPTKFDFVINLKVANQLGLAMPPSLLVFADEVIE